jgi:flagellar assembly protein FliH
MSEAFSSGAAGSDFVAGFAARHELPTAALQQVFAPASGFVVTDLVATPKSFSPQPPPDRTPRPRHFSPADRDANPTQGWDPLACDAGENAFLDPLVAAHAAGYAEGLAAAAAEAQAHAARDRALLAELSQGLAAGAHIDRGPLAERLRATVLHLVTRLVGETGIAPDILAARITAATDCLADAAESAMLRVHPDDVALLEGRLPPTVFAVGDASVTRGSFVLESASTIVEDGPEAWLDQLAQAIDRVPAPRC